MSPVHPVPAFHLLWGRVFNSPLHLPAWVAHKLSGILLAPSLILYRRAGITEAQYFTPFYMGSVDPTRVFMTQCKSFAHQDSFPDLNSGRKWQIFLTKTTPFYLIASKCGEAFDLPTPLPNLLCNTNYKLSLWLWLGFSLWFWFPFSQWLMLTPIVKKPKPITWPAGTPSSLLPHSTKLLN